MNAERLREAAALMRERAEKAEASWPSPWFYSERHSEVHHSGENGAYDRPYVSGADGWYADEHQAAWHPAVALAVADWVDAYAEAAEAEYDVLDPHALAVVDAYLGATS